MAELDHTVSVDDCIGYVFIAVTEYLRGVREEGFVLAQYSGEDMLIKRGGWVVVVAAGMWGLIFLVLVRKQRDIFLQNLDACHLQLGATSHPLKTMPPSEAQLFVHVVSGDRPHPNPP